MSGRKDIGKNSAQVERGLDLYGQLALVRLSEERLVSLFASKEVPGFIHLSIGQEAVSVGIMDALGASDTIASTHRGHGHAIAKGIDLKGFFAELLAKDTGLCRGRGGSMHVADMRIGMLGANGIVGAGVPIAVGSALAHAYAGNGHIAVSFFGDGALAEGVLHESINIARLWKLPILFVCEANGWSEFSPVESQIAFDLETWARSFDIRYECVDGNDVEAVAARAAELILTIRAGGGPALIECRTRRITGHYEGDAQKYRPTETPLPDPIEVQAAYLINLGVAQAALDERFEAAREAVDQAVDAARNAPEPDFASALADVYTRRSPDA